MNSEITVFDRRLINLYKLLFFWLNTNPKSIEIMRASEETRVLIKNCRGKNKKIIEEAIPAKLYYSSSMDLSKKIQHSEVQRAYSLFCQKIINEVMNNDSYLIMCIGVSSYILYKELTKYLHKEKVWNVIPFSRKYVLGASNGLMYLELLDLTSEALLTAKKTDGSFDEVYDGALQRHPKVMRAFDKAFKPWLGKIGDKTRKIILLDSGFLGSLLYPLSSILRQEGYGTDIWLFARYIWLDTFINLKNKSFTTDSQLLLQIEQESQNAYERKI